MSEPSTTDAPDEEEGTQALSLRLPKSLHLAIKRMAAGQMRSINNQIVLILKEAVTKNKTGSSRE